MEVFFLAMLAALVGTAATEPTPSLHPTLPPPPNPEPDRWQQMTYWFWRGMGDDIVHWNATQEAAWMMGELVCPEGHGDLSKLTYVDSPWTPLSVLRRDSAGSVYANVEDSELEPIMRRTGPGQADNEQAIGSALECSHPEHQGPHMSTIPKHVAAVLEAIP